MIIADLAVVTARLPYVDRRTLSQAWYDALHLAHPQPKMAMPRNIPPAPLLQPGLHSTVGPRPATRFGHTLQGEAPTTLGRNATGPLEVRARIHLQAKKSPSCIAAVGHNTMLDRPPQQETAVIHLPDGERICLVTRQERGHLRIIALCAEHLRARVGVALAAVQQILQQQGFYCAMGVGGIEV